MISLRTIAMILGMIVFVAWSAHQVGPWTALITLPLTNLAVCVAAELDVREGRWG